MLNTYKCNSLKGMVSKALLKSVYTYNDCLFKLVGQDRHETKLSGG